MLGVFARLAFKLPLGPHRGTFEQFARFVIVGATNTVLNFAVYIGLTRGFAFWERHFLIANAIAFAVAVMSSFLFNNYWTFKRGGTGAAMRGAKFLTVVATALAWNNVILYGLTEIGLHDLLAKLVVVGIVGLWNFTLYKFWAFRR